MRESVVYVLLFLLIVGAGAVLIVPRLLRAPAIEPVDPGTTGPGAPDAGTGTGGPRSDAGGEDDPSAPPRVHTRVTSMLPGHVFALPTGVEVLVTGVGGPLEGPLKPLVGARLVTQPGPSDREPRLTFDATAPRVAFGAVGHQWVEVPIGDLVTGGTIELPRAAPPIVLRVREADGSPAVDVPAIVRPASPLGRLRSDAGGTLVIDHAPPGLVTVDFTTAERAGPRLRLRVGVDRDLDVHLEPLWTVRGRVLDPEGGPVSGATVEAFAAAGPWGRAQKTDADGRFEWTGRATADCAFRVRAGELAEVAVEATPPCVGALVTDLGDLQMTGFGVSIACRVESAVPGTDTYVEVEPQVAAIVRELFGNGVVLDRARREPVGDDGFVRFEGLPPGVPLRVSVRGAGVRSDAIVSGSSGETHRITLTPEPGHTLAGVLHTPDGEPVSGARVLVSREPRDGDQAQPDDHAITTSAKGAFERFGFPGRRVYLRAYVPGFRSLLRRVTLPLDHPLDLVLEPSLIDEDRRVQGTVVDEAGEALAGVTVRAAGVRAVTDDTGRFRLDGVESLAPVVAVAFGFEPGPLHASAPHPRRFVSRAVFGLTPGAGQDLELVLPYSARLTLRALDGVDETPMGFVHVVVLTDRGRLLFDRGVAPVDGRIEIDDLSLRDGPVTIPRQTLPDGTVRVASQPSATLRVGLVATKRRAEQIGRLADGVVALSDVHLPHGMKIVGHVRNRRGAAVAGARVAGMDDGWQSRGADPLFEREVLFRTTETDADGRFVLEGFDPRRPADLAVWAEGFAPAAHRVLLPPFSDDIETEVEIEIDEGGYVLLLLQDEGTKRPIEGALMDLEHARDGADHLDLLRAGVLGGLVGSTREWQSASEHFLFADREPGAYAVGPMRPGPYEIWVERLGYEPLRRKITVFGKGENVFDPYKHTSRTVQGDQTRMVFLMRGTR